MRIPSVSRGVCAGLRSGARVSILVSRSSILSRLPLRFSRFVPLSLLLILAVVLTARLAPYVVAQPLRVTHIRPASETDPRNAYFIDLLDLVLAKTEGAYQLVAHQTGMQQGRALKQLNKGEGLDIVMTSTEREQALLAIRIPLLSSETPLDQPQRWHPY